MSLHHGRAPQRIAKVVALTTVPERITTDHIFCTRAVIVANKAARTANTSVCYIGPTSADGSQDIDINQGGLWTLEQIDLYDWFIDVGTNNDGVIVLYW